MQTQKPSRPIGVTIVAVLALAVGIIGMIAGAVIIGFSGLLATTGFFGFGGLLAGLALIIAGVVIFFSTIWVLVGWGLFQGKGWAWTLGLIFSVISLLFTIGAAAMGSISGIVGVAIWVLMIYYFFTRPVKAFFGKAQPISPAGFSTGTTSSLTGARPTLSTGSLPGSSSMGTFGSGSGPTNKASTGTRFCSNCGATLNSGQTKCTSCGTSSF